MTQQRPVIGIPMQTLHAIDGIPEGLPTSWVMNQRYILTLTAAGAVPWMIPLFEVEDDRATLREIYSRLDAVFLSGGVDMDPASYGEPRHPLLGRIDPPRDRSELQLARWAMRDGKPVLGVCRGMQVVNVAAGGTLFQDVEAEYPGAIKHDYFPTQGFERHFLAHPMKIAKDSLLGRVFEANECLVNSMHHQGVKMLGEGLRACAWAPDGLIEAVETTDGSFVLGVQWHPEMLSDSCTRTRRLFDAFTDAAVGWRGSQRVTGSAA